LDSSFLSQLDFLRRGRTELDLNSSSKTPEAREINDSSYGGKKSTSILFSRIVGIATIKITVSIRRFTDKFGHISKGCWTKDIKTKRNVRAWYMSRGRVRI
jgi:hypothetical protein